MQTRDASSEMLIKGPVLVQFPDEDFREAYIEIVSSATGELVIFVEVISPTNKADDAYGINR
jgi:hypothetical protein